MGDGPGYLGGSCVSTGTPAGSPEGDGRQQRRMWAGNVEAGTVPSEGEPRIARSSLPELGRQGDGVSPGTFGGASSAHTSTVTQRDRCWTSGLQSGKRISLWH